MLNCKLNSTNGGTFSNSAEKSFGNISNEQVFTVDPYFGGTQNLGQPEKHFFDTFF